MGKRKGEGRGKGKRKGSGKRKSERKCEPCIGHRAPANGHRACSPSRRLPKVWQPRPHILVHSRECVSRVPNFFLGEWSQVSASPGSIEDAVFDPHVVDLALRSNYDDSGNNP